MRVIIRVYFRSKYILSFYYVTETKSINVTICYDMGKNQCHNYTQDTIQSEI